jgi:MFS transporter, DHA2 family, multidrug resistance protein
LRPPRRRLASRGRSSFPRSSSRPRSTTAELAEHASPFNEILSLHGFDLSSMGGLLAISREIDRQAAMIAYVNDFHIMTLLAFGALPLILLASGRRAG